MRSPASGKRAVLASLLVVLGFHGATAALAGQHRQHHPPRRHAHARRPLVRPTWLHGVKVSEYYPVPESWFVGTRVAAPGLRGRHRVDWLYSARGLAVEGDGIDLSGRRVHVAALGEPHGFVDSRGRRTAPGANATTDGGPPFWTIGGYWLTRAHALTFPLEAGGWSAGAGVRFRAPPSGLQFADGPSLALVPYRSLAVDPRLIPLGSSVYIPAYRGLDGASGWFVAQDTGSAIIDHHVDVFRRPPARLDGARLLTGQRILVVPPGTRYRGSGAVPAPSP